MSPFHLPINPYSPIIFQDLDVLKYLHECLITMWILMQIQIKMQMQKKFYIILNKFRELYSLWRSAPSKCYF